MATPMLKPSYTWFTPNVSSVKRTTITTINFVDSYTPNGIVTDSWDASLEQDGGIMCYVEDTILTIAGNGSGSILANPDSSRMFSYVDDNTSDLFSKLTTINGLTLLDTSNCENMERLFRSCTALTTMDISNFNTSKVKNFSMTFAVMNALTSLSVAHLDTSSCEDMSYMFYSTRLTTIDFEDWDVSKVKSFDHFMSSGSSVRNIDVSKWNVSSCENFNAAFHNVSATSYDESGWDVSNVKVFSQMFESNTNLTKIIGLENWNTSNGICFEEMFLNCSKLSELNLSSFDTRKAHSGTSTSTNGSTSANTLNMLSGLIRLKKIILGKNFTFLGDGTSSEIGSLPTPSSNYITGADGKWYSIESDIYTPTEVPNLTYGVYCASADLAKSELESRKYISYANLKLYHESLKEYINNAIKAYVDENILTE